MPKRNTYKVGALCAGYGGLELGLRKIAETQTSWVSDFESVPSRILDKRFIGPSRNPVLNYGDLTAIRNPAPVDIVTAGAMSTGFS